MHEPTGQLIMPPSYIAREAHAVAKAVKEYDDRLEFGLHPVTDQWVVTIRTEDGEIPIMGFGRPGAPLPHPDDVTKRLYNADTRRHGDRIRERINRHNEARRKELNLESQEQIDDATDQMEFYLRKLSKQTGASGGMGKIFVPGKD